VSCDCALQAASLRVELEGAHPHSKAVGYKVGELRSTPSTSTCLMRASRALLHEVLTQVLALLLTSLTEACYCRVN
jgi:hypothetical protein